MSRRKHNATDMIYAWAKDAGVKGYDQYDPKARSKRIQDGINFYNRRHAVDSKPKVQYKYYCSMKRAKRYAGPECNSRQLHQTQDRVFLIGAELGSTGAEQVSGGLVRKPP